MADPGFLLGAPIPLVGASTMMRVLFGENTCQNGGLAVVGGLGVGVPLEFASQRWIQGVPLAHSPNGTQFFCFWIHFCRKATALEVSAPMGNPGSTAANGYILYILFQIRQISEERCKSSLVLQI